MEEIASEASTNINEAAAQLMKFHGSYQQDNRDKRTSGKGKFYQFMMRTRQPAGLVSNQLYLVMDTLADKVRPPAGPSRITINGHCSSGMLAHCQLLMEQQGKMEGSWWLLSTWLPVSQLMPYA